MPLKIISFTLITFFVWISIAYARDHSYTVLDDQPNYEGKAYNDQAYHEYRYQKKKNKDPFKDPGFQEYLKQEKQKQEKIPETKKTSSPNHRHSRAGGNP